MGCPSCEGNVVSPEGQNGERVCSSCGLVLSKSSVIRTSFVQWHPILLSNWHQGDSETLKEWLTILRTISCQLNIPNFPYREEVARRIRKEKPVFFKSQRFGKNKRATIAALIQIVLKQYGKDRPLKEICRQLSLDKKLVIKQCWTLNKTAIDSQSQFASIPRKTCTDYLFENGTKITNDIKVLSNAEDALMKIRRTGGNPVALASGALYHICRQKKMKVSKKQIGEVFKISPRTVYTNEVRIRTLLQKKYPERQNSSLPRMPFLMVNQRHHSKV